MPLFSIPVVKILMCSPIEMSGLHVTVDRVVHAPQLEAPPDRPHPFVYYITVTNQSTEPVTIKGRKWVVTDAEGRCMVIEGDGVVGQFPHLKPQAQYSYNSYHPIGSDSVAEGALFGVTESGEAVFARIPRFEMRVPVRSA